jgi:hypothetical protein
MSHSNRLTIRIPDHLKQQLDMVSVKYDMTINDVIKFSIINGINIFDISPVQFDSKNPLNGAVLTASALVEKKQGDSKNPLKSTNLTATDDLDVQKVNVPFDSKNAEKPANLTAASRAPNRDIYLLNKKDIVIYNTKLQFAWEEFVQHRKELRKSIKPTQLKRMWSGFDEIISKFGVDTLIGCLNKSVEMGWAGVFAPPEQINQVSSKHVFTENDL